MKIQGPVEVELKVGIHSNDEDVRGTVTIGMGIGVFPTEEQIRERVKKFADEEMPDGYHLMSKQEYWDAFCDEKLGGRYAFPGSREWDA